MSHHRLLSWARRRAEGAGPGLTRAIPPPDLRGPRRSRWPRLFLHLSHPRLLPLLPPLRSSEVLQGGMVDAFFFFLFLFRTSDTLSATEGSGMGARAPGGSQIPSEGGR